MFRRFIGSINLRKNNIISVEQISKADRKRRLTSTVLQYHKEEGNSYEKGIFRSWSN